MKEKECVPFAPSLTESMRSIGYSFKSAIADLLDNSISAGAKHIRLFTEPSSDPWLIIFDDGCGMTDEELYEAMRYGSSDPTKERDPNDLGRFGLGMKSASLSQCRRFTVVSKKNGKISGYSWDLDYVIEKGKWALKQFDEDEISRFPRIDMIDHVNHGTYIILEDFDRIKEGASNYQASFDRCISEMQDHISLVFHRFINDGLSFEFNGAKIEGRDPFLSESNATQKKKEVSINIDGKQVKMKVFILPHRTKLTEKDIIKLGGEDRLREDQGFYVYRNKRLIIWGTWFRLEHKDELNKLARVRVDIPNTLDYMWNIDVKKSTATLPDKIKKNMYGAIVESVSVSRNVHQYRGRKVKEDDDGIANVWEKIKLREGYEYVINRELPQIKLLQSMLNDDQAKTFSNVLTTIEKAFPTYSIYVDEAAGKIEDNSQEDDELWKLLEEQMKMVRQMGMPEKQWYETFMNSEPFNRSEKTVQRIKEVISRL